LRTAISVAQFRRDVKPEWLLIYKIEDDNLYLVRTGTSDLF
jgi:mRNA-degrading endonuclease YafQ of YafQ-DinJ toxin-antitoxin module